MAHAALNPSADKPAPLAHNVATAARLAGIGESTLWQAIAAGKVKAVKLGRRTLITEAELGRVLREGF